MVRYDQFGAPALVFRNAQGWKDSPDAGPHGDELKDFRLVQKTNPTRNSMFMRSCKTEVRLMKGLKPALPRSDLDCSSPNL